MLKWNPRRRRLKELWKKRMFRGREHWESIGHSVITAWIGERMSSLLLFISIWGHVISGMKGHIETRETL